MVHSDTLSTPTGGQKKRGKINHKMGIILVQKGGQFSYQHPIIVAVEALEASFGSEATVHTQKPGLPVIRTSESDSESVEWE